MGEDCWRKVYLATGGCGVIFRRLENGPNTLPNYRVLPTLQTAVEWDGPTLKTRVEWWGQSTLQCLGKGQNTPDKEHEREESGVRGFMSGEVWCQRFHVRGLLSGRNVMSGVRCQVWM